MTGFSSIRFLTDFENNLQMHDAFKGQPKLIDQIKASCTQSLAQKNSIGQKLTHFSISCADLFTPQIQTNLRFHRHAYTRAQEEKNNSLIDLKYTGAIFTFIITLANLTRTDHLTFSDKEKREFDQSFIDALRL
jgi:hypothetical protein